MNDDFRNLMGLDDDASLGAWFVIIVFLVILAVLVAGGPA